MSTREREGILVGVGAGLMLIVLLVLQSFVGSGLFSTKTVAFPPSQDYAEVAAAYSDHLSTFSSRNISAILDEFASNATVDWKGQAGGLEGNYTGAEAMENLLKDFPGHMVNLTLSEEGQPIVGVQGGHMVAGSTFGWSGYTTIFGVVSGMVVAEDSYVHVGGAWLISEETWNYVMYNEQFPVST
jgi:hypothetical protein